MTVQITTIFRVMQPDTILQNALFEEERACDGKISRNGILISRENLTGTKKLNFHYDWLFLLQLVCTIYSIHNDSKASATVIAGQ